MKKEAPRKRRLREFGFQLVDYQVVPPTLPIKLPLEFPLAEPPLAVR